MLSPSRPCAPFATAVVVLVTAGMLTGCTGPSPGDQRDDVLTAATGVVEHLERFSGLTDLEVVDDGTTATPCPPNGEHHRYLAYGSTTAYRDTVAVEERMKDIINDLYSSQVAYPVLGDTFTAGTHSVPDGDDPHGTVTWRAPRGPLAGAALNADLIPLDDGIILVRIEVTTVCR